MADITLFGEVRCHKTRFYQAALEERGLDYELAEVDKDADAARRLASLAGWAPQAISVAAVILLHLWKKNNLVSIFGGTLLYMVLVQFVFL